MMIAGNTRAILRLLRPEDITRQIRRTIAGGHLRYSSKSAPVVEEPKQFNETLILPEEDRKDFFRLKNLFSIEDLMNARVHYGHKEAMLCGHMRPFIFGKRLGVLIFDLEQTAKLLDQALHVTAEIAYREGIILFVSRSRQTGYLVEEAAKEVGEYAHCRRWRDDIFSDSKNIFGSVTRLPDLVIMLSIVDEFSKQHNAAVMSSKMLIPTVGICDTDSDPRIITYPIPGNDDTPESIEFYCKLFKTAIVNGKAKRKDIIEKYGQEFYEKTLEFEENRCIT